MVWSRPPVESMNASFAVNMQLVTWDAWPAYTLATGFDANEDAAAVPMDRPRRTQGCRKSRTQQSSPPVASTRRSRLRETAFTSLPSLSGG